MLGLSFIISILIVVFEEVMKMDENRISIVISTGTEEKMIMLGVLAQTAANLGMGMSIFVTGTALKMFLKNGFMEKSVVPAGFESFMGGLREGLAKVKFPGWHSLLETAKETGSLKIMACSLMSSALNLKMADLDPLVDGIVGATDFMINSGGGQIIAL